jgi:hypothetical protein
MQIPHDNFQRLIDPENQVCLLLASHWIALKQIMATITETEHRQRPNQKKEGDVDVGMIRWLRHVNRQIDDDHQLYNQWPLWIEARLEQDLGFFGKEVY